MQKKALIGSVAIVLFVIAAGGSYFFFGIGKESSTNQTVNTAVSPTPFVPSTTTADYTDEAGFVFSYPDDVTVEKKESKDTTIYSSLQLTSKKTPGNIAVNIVETKQKTLDAWFKEQSLASSSAKAITLAGIKGMELQTPTGLVTAALDQGIVFVITVTAKDTELSYWRPVSDALVSSFQFAQPATQTGATTNDSSAIEFEGEEIIE